MWRAGRTSAVVESWGDEARGVHRCMFFYHVKLEKKKKKKKKCNFIIRYITNTLSSAFNSIPVPVVVLLFSEINLF